MRLTRGTALLWLLGVAAAPAQGLKPPLGSQVSVSVSGERSLSGELVAVDRDSIWLLQRESLASVPLWEVSQVRVDRGGMGATGALVWSLIAGVVSGVALQSACSSVREDCGSVLPATLGIWALIGVVSAGSLQSSRFTTLPPEPDSLRARARFPQGLPAALARDSLAPPRTDNQ